MIEQWPSADDYRRAISLLEQAQAELATDTAILHRIRAVVRDIQGRIDAEEWNGYAREVNAR